MKNLIIMLLFAGAIAVGSAFTFLTPEGTSQTTNDLSQHDVDCFLETTEYLNNVSTNAANEPVIYPEGQATITSKVVVWEPGFETGVHKHPVPIVISVFSGELTVEFENGETMVTKAGEAYVSTPGLWHTGSNRGAENLVAHAVYLGTDKEKNTIAKE
jgi:quercetin dioxygenase-like cupin family protein